MSPKNWIAVGDIILIGQNRSAASVTLFLTRFQAPPRVTLGIMPAGAARINAGRGVSGKAGAGFAQQELAPCSRADGPPVNFRKFKQTPFAPNDSGLESAALGLQEFNGALSPAVLNTFPALEHRGPSRRLVTLRSRI